GARNSAPVFRQHPGWSVFFAGVAGLAVITIPLALRDPEYRAAFIFSVNALASLKFVVVTALVALGWIIFIPVTMRVWRSAWTFEITPDRLVATHQFTRRRHQIPWESIAAVTKLAPSVAMKSARLQFNHIEVTDGTELLFSPHLAHYSEF